MAGTEVSCQHYLHSLHLLTNLFFHVESIPMVLAVNKLDLIKDYEETGQELEFYMKQQYLDKFAEEHGY